MTDTQTTPEQGDNGTPSDNGDSAKGTAKQAPIMIPKARLDEALGQKRALEEQLNAVAETLLADVPESFHDLVPNLPAGEKVKWIQNAKAKGLFADNATQTEKPKVPATDTKAPKTAPREEDLSALPPQLRIARALGGGKK